MKSNSLWAKIKKVVSPKENIPETPVEQVEQKKYKILLLTNRDSDNVGDQVIEASDIALIKAVMKNLGIEEKNYEINSRAAAIVPKKYVDTRDEKLLVKAEEAISECDMLIFGGAPLFNYLYQIFYERTAVTLEIAQKYNKPVIFSAIGIERYTEDNAKCQRLKKTLNFDCVKQITTRDGIEELTKYRENENMVIARVADPAVFAGPAFKNHTVSKKDREKKKIGIFVFRANGFVDNKINFTREDAAKLWLDIIHDLEEKGYDYELVTSGNFGDEAFLDYMIRNHGISETKCVFNMNMPERLLKKISSYDAVISCRLHPSIISFSLGVPSIGIIWNPKVRHFYECINYGGRAVPVDGISAEGILAKVEEAMEQGVEKDTEYLMTVYRTLYSGIKKSLEIEGEDAPYSYEALLENIPAYPGTSAKEKETKLKRKFRRIYDTTNARLDELTVFKEKAKNAYECKMYYHSGSKGEQVVPVDGWEAIAKGDMKRLPSGSMECVLTDTVKNDGSFVFPEQLYINGDKEFVTWRVRFCINNVWFWYITDDTYCPKASYDKKKNRRVKSFLPGDVLPAIPLPGIADIVLEAEWKDREVEN